MDNVGVIHGRFQMLHKGHMEYLLDVKKRCEYLIIGIANPDVTLTKHTDFAPHRSTSTANPLTYYERFQMIKHSMINAGVNRNEFDVVPFPINFPDILFNYVPKEATFYITMYSDWDKEKKQMLEKFGCKIGIIHGERTASGTQIRNCIINDEPWNHLVPSYVYDFIITNGIDNRMKQVI